MNKIVITGGHHSSAIPIIEELYERNPNLKVYWFGHRYTIAGSKSDSLEYQEVRPLVEKFFVLHAGKFYKTFNPLRLLKIPVGFIQAFLLLVRLKPDLVLSFGGYLAPPVVFGAWLLKIPIVTHEQTVVIGYANKFVSKFADLILYTWRSSEKYLPSEKSKLTGIPLRENIFEVKSNEFQVNSDLPTIYITAGKTGSHLLNTLVLENMHSLLQKANIIHQCGDSTQFDDYTRLLKMYKKVHEEVPGNYFCEKFIFKENIGEAFAKADMVVSRSGAHITYELMALKKPCLLIPISWVSHNEQFENASYLKSIGLGDILEETNITPKKFLTEVFKVLDNLDKFQPRGIEIDIDSIKNNSLNIVDHLEAVYAKSLEKKKKTKSQDKSR